MSKLSTKNQVTIPARVLRELGIKPGDELLVYVEDHRIIAEPVESRRERVMRYAGSMVYPKGYLEELRNEWER